VRQGQRLLAVETEEIAWFMAEDKLCFLRTWDNRRYLVDYTLEELAEMLDPALFYRANRSYMVHVKAVKSIESYFNGKLLLRLSPPAEPNEAIVSKEKATDFKKWMGK
jgi:DNA-binding LytR/AlgR family response regulator